MILLLFFFAFITIEFLDAAFSVLITPPLDDHPPYMLAIDMHKYHPFSPLRIPQS